jgi:hypothetical protein
MVGPFHLDGFVFAAAVLVAYNVWRAWRRD